MRGPKAMSLSKKTATVKKRFGEGYYSKGIEGVANVEPKVSLKKSWYGNFIQIKQCVGFKNELNKVEIHSQM